MRRNITKFLGAFCIALAVSTLSIPGSLACAGDLSFVEDVPETFLFGTPNGEVSQGTANTQQAFGFRTDDEIDANGTRTRGQSFTFVTGDGLTHPIGSLSVSLNNPFPDVDVVRPDGQLELTIFEWDSNDPGNDTGWIASSGGTFGAGHVELFRESFPILSTAPLTMGNLVQIAFAPGDLQLTDGTSYGFLFRYTLDELVDGSGDPLSADVTFPFDTRTDNDLDGFLLVTNPAPDFADAPHVAPSDTPRTMNFFFTAASDGVVGDFNGDGFVNCDDIDEYRGILGSPADAALAGFDLEVDETINFADVENFIENFVETPNGQVGTFVGDLNCDGQVNVLGDALILVSALGTASDSYSEGDANLDGTVNVLGDAILLISNLGNSNAL